MATSAGRAARMPTTVNTRPPTSDMTAEVCTVLRTRSGSRAPTPCATTTVVPAAMPVNRLTTMFTRLLVPPPTAASACLPTNWPTIMASKVL